MWSWDHQVEVMSLYWIISTPDRPSWDQQIQVSEALIPLLEMLQIYNERNQHSSLPHYQRPNHTNTLHWRYKELHPSYKLNECVQQVIITDYIWFFFVYLLNQAELIPQRTAVVPSFNSEHETSLSHLNQLITGPENGLQNELQQYVFINLIYQYINFHG